MYSEKSMSPLAIIKNHTVDKTSLIFNVYHVIHIPHGSPLLQWSNFINFLTGPCQFPILLVLVTQVYPLLTSLLAVFESDPLHHVSVEIKNRLVSLILR